ncbi:putative polyketide synthase [Xylariaceae sp. FL1272]|nr:putative polyketide synthase [Xylariaceae sp. FL1272]
MKEHRLNGVEAGCSGSSQDAIAIVGMGCRWPGGVRNLSQLWELLENGRDGWTRFKADHINLDGYYHPNGQRPGSMFTEGAHLLQEDPKLFDHAFFGITAVEAMSMDPSQRKLLEVTYEAFENAGVPWHEFSGSKTGVFIGNFNNEHQVMQFRDLDHPLPYVVTGGGATILSNRISHVFNLQGPSMVIDTACSASMYALHVAVLSIQNGDCDAAIVGSGNLILNPDAQLFTTKLNAISPTSRSHTFDASADGYSRAEGFGAIYIKRLSDAIEHGDPVRAIIRGTAYNANGKTGGISHPSPIGQEAVIRQAYKVAGLDVEYFFILIQSLAKAYKYETDLFYSAPLRPIEVAAIGEVFGKANQHQPLLIGSIKPNLGHSEPASALAQIMKVVLAMEHGQIPATIGISKLNPAIDFEKSRTQVVTTMTSWPSSKLRRVSINSFGYGGANAHCILDSACIVPAYQLHGLPLSLAHKPNTAITRNSASVDTANTEIERSISVTPTEPEIIQTRHAEARAQILIPLSAHDEQAFKNTVKIISSSSQQYKLPDLLYTLGARRSQFNVRGFAVVQREALHNGLDYESLIVSRAPAAVSRNICFIFTGQGAQWPTMGAKLIDEYAVFRESIRYLDFVLAQLHDRPSWKIEELLLDPEIARRIHEPAFSQTVCTALQIALINLLGSWGIGHSSGNTSFELGKKNAKIIAGEIAAAYASGRIKASQAIVFAYFRGKVVSDSSKDGLMIAVGLGPAEVQPYLVGHEERVRIAAYNSLESTTLSGDSEAISSIADKLTARNVFNRILKTQGHAYHSHHMLSLGEIYEQQTTRGLRDIAMMSDPLKPQTLWISSVKPQGENVAVMPKYWRRNLESPVQFAQAVIKLAHDESADLMIEIGPHTALSGPLKQLRKREARLPPYLGSLQRDENDVKCMLTLAGRLFLSNAPVNLVAVNASERIYHKRHQLCHGYHCVDMPQYSFSYPAQPLYLENRFNREVRLRRYLRHDLLGARAAGGSKSHPSWRNILRVKDLPWLNDHKLVPHVVLPAAAYIAMAVEAVRQIHDEETVDAANGRTQIRGFKLRNVVINSVMRLDDNEHGVETILNMEKVSSTSSTAAPGWYKFTIGSMPVTGNQIWNDHCSGMICVETEDVTIDKACRLGIDPRSRLLQVHRWYDKFQEIGLGFGPTFQCLSKLLAYRGACNAAADVALDSTSGLLGESKYALHPAAIDACLQLALISLHSGQVENAKKAFVPVSLSDISIWTSDISGNNGSAVASGKFVGQRSAYAQTQLFTTTGHPLLDIRGMKCTMLDVNGRSHDSPQLKRNPYWKIVSLMDIDTITNDLLQSSLPTASHSKHLMDEIDELCKLVIIGMGQSISEQQTKRQWTGDNQIVEWFRVNASQYKPDQILHVDLSGPDSRMRQLFSSLNHVPEVRCLEIMHAEKEQLLSGRTSIPDLLMENRVIYEVFDIGVLSAGAHAQLKHLIKLETHKRPGMRILQLGGRTGKTTAVILEALQSEPAFKTFQEYTFTDPIGVLVAEAETEFTGHEGMSFRVFDIEQDPEIQGLAKESYDLIVANGFLGQCVNVPVALSHVRQLLRPKGSLILTEITTNRLSLEVLSRLLSGSWVPDRQIRDSETWNELLVDAGFQETQIDVQDCLGEEALATTMLTRLSSGLSSRLTNSLNGCSPQEPDIYLVYRDYPPPLAAYIRKVMASHGFNCVNRSLSAVTELEYSSRVVSLIDIEDASLIHHGPDQFEAIRALIARSAHLEWVGSRSSNSHCCDSAAMKGILRSVATENVLLNVVHVEIDGPYYHNLTRTAELIAMKLVEMLSWEPGATVDREYVLRGDAFYIDRLVPEVAMNQQFRLRHKLEQDTQRSIIDGEQALKPVYAQPGLISSLSFEQDHLHSKPLRDDWIEVKTKAIGLNMKDVAVATAKFDSDYQSHEGAGIVERVGAAVTAFKKGDHVYGLILGNMGTYLRCPAQVIAKIPKGESFVSAATMPVSYLAAMYALRRLAHLQSGETVFIESAAGSLGIAAIQISQHIGAVVYATVGSEEKRRFLIDRFGIPPERIFRSRQANLTDDIMRVTGGKGFDIILSTSQDAMHEIWRCIGSCGRFIDLGRSAVLRADNLSLEVFKRNASFASFDIAAIGEERPHFIQQLMTELTELWTTGVVKPIDPVTCFEISQLSSAMAFFAKGQHMGKVVLEFDKTTVPATLVNHTPHAQFDPDGAYLLVGGLGGLGRALSLWMAERGARHIVYLSRSATRTPDAESLLNSLVGMGVSPQVLCCDITDYEAVEAAISSISASRSIKGLIHAAMVEGDSLFDRTSYSQVQAVLAPKISGTVNLHRATHHISLDFFVVTSSLVGMIGTSTQSAYCAANAFQNAFAQYRLSQGLPAISLDLGLILEVGSVSQAKNVQQSLQRVATYGQSETEFLELFEGALCVAQETKASQALASNLGHIVTGLEPGRLASPKDNRVLTDLVWHNDARFGFVLEAAIDLQHSQSQSNPTTITNDKAHSVTMKLATAASPQAKTAILEEAITTHIAELIGVSKDEIDVSKAMSNYGIDSLAAAELRNWLVVTFGMEVTTIQLLGETAKVRSLAAMAMEGLEGRKKSEEKTSE